MRRAVLVGAGHAHLYTLKRAGAFVERGWELVLVAPEPFWYSGLATGMLGGIYPPELDCIDAAALVAGNGGRHIADRATAIDAEAGLLHLEHGPPLRYDALSLATGSEPPALPGAEGHYAVKPIRNLWRLRQDLERRMAARGARPVRVVVAGGGATAAEIAANIAGLAEARDGAVEVTVLSGGDRFLRQLPAAAAAGATRSLQRRGIAIRLGSRVARVEAAAAVTTTGDRLPLDLFVNAVGLQPSPLVRASGLPTDGAGGLIVDRYLRSTADRRIHGGGDCIAFEGEALPRIGVYAIRQAPVLFHNLLAALAGTPPQPFVPQRRFLLILNLGDGTGLATRGGLHWRGRLAFRLKDAIDRRFLAEYRA